MQLGPSRQAMIRLTHSKKRNPRIYIGNRGVSGGVTYGESGSDSKPDGTRPHCPPHHSNLPLSHVHVSHALADIHLPVALLVEPLAVEGAYEAEAAREVEEESAAE